MKFERSEEYMGKISLDALDREVYIDSKITCQYQNGYSGKIKAYCHDTNTYLQFPSKIRTPGRKFVADVVKMQKKNGGTVFFRAYKGSIRETVNGDVIA